MDTQRGLQRMFVVKHNTKPRLLATKEPLLHAESKSLGEMRGWGGGGGGGYSGGAASLLVFVVHAEVPEQSSGISTSHPPTPPPPLSSPTPPAPARPTGVHTQIDRPGHTLSNRTSSYRMTGTGGPRYQSLLVTACQTVRGSGPWLTFSHSVTLGSEGPHWQKKNEPVYVPDMMRVSSAIHFMPHGTTARLANREGAMHRHSRTANMAGGRQCTNGSTEDMPRR